jgi:hypothetical protein
MNTKKMIELLPEHSEVVFLQDTTSTLLQGGKSEPAPVKAGEKGAIIHIYEGTPGVYVIELSDPPRICETPMFLIKPVNYSDEWPIPL